MRMWLFVGFVFFQGCASIRVGDMSLKYPRSLSKQEANPDVITLTNFNGKYANGGIIPANGFEITVMAGEHAPQTSNCDPDDRLIFQTARTVANQPGTETVCEVDYQVFKMVNASVTVDHRQVFYKLFLTFYPDDSGRQLAIQVFDRILASVRFK